MKIVYIAFSRLPTEKAHGLQIMKTCEALANRGTEVDLVVPIRRNHIPDDPFEYYGVEKNLKLTRVPTADLVDWGSVGFVFSVMLFSERARFTSNFWSADFIYSRDALVLFQYILLGRRMVYEAHKVPTRLARFVAKRVERVVVISEALKTVYQNAGVRPECIVVAPDGVDVEKFSVPISTETARATLRLMVQGPIAVYTGHLYERKGVYTLAAAAEESGVETYFVGGTPEDVRTFRAAWGTVKNIHIIGHRPPTEIPLWLKAASVLVIPNSGKDQDSSTYTSPMKLAEYLASGTPIIASRVPALEEGLGGSATFVDPDSASALGAALKREHKPPTKKPYSWDERANVILSALTS